MIIGSKNGCGRARQKNASFVGNGPRWPRQCPQVAPRSRAKRVDRRFSFLGEDDGKPRFQHLKLPAPASGVIITRHSGFQKAPWESYDILLQGFRGLQYLRVHAALRHRLLAP
jgi:hypothetical protein